MTAYYNEIDEYAAQWLRNLIDANLIARGTVDTRSIVDVTASDLAGFTQCHFFAGIGGWSLGARLAGWPDERPLWTGSCPCQPFSVAGKGAGQADERHLWPEFYRLIAAERPAVVMGEQVAAAVGKSWLDGVCNDLERIGYATGAAVVPACAVDAPHRRDRLWFVADNAAPGEGRRGILRPGSGSGKIDQRAPSQFAGSCDCNVRDASGAGLSLPECAAVVGSGRRDEGRAVAEPSGAQGAWADSVWITGADGKARRVKPGIRLLVNGVSGRVAVSRPGEQGEPALHWYNRIGALRAFGNAIVPQVAAEIIGAYLDCAP